MEHRVIDQLTHIASCIRKAGYEPYDQILGYLSTGDSRYITREGNSRAMIEVIDKKDVREFLSEVLTQHMKWRA